jgi:hypothetical protein
MFPESLTTLLSVSEANQCFVKTVNREQFVTEVCYKETFSYWTRPPVRAHARTHTQNFGPFSLYSVASSLKSSHKNVSLRTVHSNRNAELMWMCCLFVCYLCKICLLHLLTSGSQNTEFVWKCYVCFVYLKIYVLTLYQNTVHTLWEQ